MLTTEASSFARTRLIYSSWYGDLGGGELRMIDHLQRTRIPRNQILVLLMQQGKMQTHLEQAGFRVAHTGWHRTRGPFRYRLGSMIGSRAVHSILHRTPRAAVVCNTFRDLQTTGPIAAAYRLPIVWRARADTFVPWSGLNRDTLSQAVQFVNEHVCRVITTTRYEANAMVDQGVRSELVRTVYNGVPMYCSGARARGEALRRHLGIPGESVVGATVARLIPQKGYEVLLPAMAAALPDAPECHLIIAGDITLDPQGSAYKEKLWRLRRELGLEGIVHFLGFTDDVAAVLNAADFLVHPAMVEPFGTALVEGMAAALPIIAPDLPGPREILSDGESALFHEPGNTEELTRCIVQLAKDSRMRASLGAKGRLRAEAFFDVERNMAQLDDICLEALP